jgi:hypothetical protein
LQFFQLNNFSKLSKPGLSTHVNFLNTKKIDNVSIPIAKIYGFVKDSRKKILFLFFSLSLISSAFAQNEFVGDTKPLLRIFPIHRFEECDWAIRPFVCHKCILKNERYAQKIHFSPEGRTYREHGCYTEQKGFYLID